MNRLSACIALGTLLLASGCATAQSKRRDTLLQEFQTFTYDKPLDEVWQEARLLLAERDYMLVGEDAKAVGQTKYSAIEQALSPAHETSTDDYDAATFQILSGTKHKDRQWLDTGWDYYRQRYHLEGRRLPEGCQVLFFKLKQDLASGGFTTRERDVEMELDLARRVAPARAQELESKANAASK
jgi:hypothetical protein